MRGPRVVLWAAVLSLIVPNVAAAQNWLIVYETDFSSDPRWTTSDDGDTLYYWDSSTDAYYVDEVNIDSGGHFGVYPVYHNGCSFLLEWDTKIESSDYASGLNFGLYSPSIHDGSDLHVRLLFAHADEGHSIYLGWIDSSGAASDFQFAVQWAYDTWYHARLEYDAGAKTLTADVSLSSGGPALFTLTGTDVGPFGTGMLELGSGNLRYGPFQVPGARMIGRFDNVTYAVDAWGDMNCDCSVTSADIIKLVNYVFKSGPLPCFPWIPLP